MPIVPKLTYNVCKHKPERLNEVVAFFFEPVGRKIVAGYLVAKPVRFRSEFQLVSSMGAEGARGTEYAC